MRLLLYVPVIHDAVDLGSAGALLSRESAAAVGERHWKAHQETMRGFWESVESYLCAFDAARLKVYQDGLAADGGMGRRVVEDAARRGSRNYQTVLRLLDEGAELRKTEDPALLLREREHLASTTEQKPPAEPLAVVQQHQPERECLLEKRDRFIAETINATLKAGEIGVLFIGAYHQLLPHLAEDISVVMVKEPKALLAYFGSLFTSPEDKGLKKLAEYLASPVSVRGKAATS